ncbi:MAG: hypothetical protein Ta2A_09280 [Treponemataceae bacterium]|nr:MAG: hypothetical protein Ta2A_09280 [Treponemataceae bacterium]
MGCGWLNAALRWRSVFRACGFWLAARALAQRAVFRVRVLLCKTSQIFHVMRNFWLKHLKLHKNHLT